MPDKTKAQTTDVIQLAVEIVSAYVSNNSCPGTDLPVLIARVHAALDSIVSSGGAAATEVVEKPTAAQIRKSLAHDGIVSFIDGKAYKTLKRHLTSHGLNPYSYRQRYGLPSDYPMTAMSYSEQRSQIAKNIGLGKPGSMTA